MDTIIKWNDTLLTWNSKYIRTAAGGGGGGGWPTSGLLSRFSFNSDANDEINGYNWTLTLGNGAFMLVAGRNALNFGSTTVMTNNIGGLLSTPCSVVFWVYIVDNSADRYICWTLEQNQFKVDLSTPNPGFNIENNKYNNTATVGWHHIVIAKDAGGFANIYVDAVHLGSNWFGGTLGSQTLEFPRFGAGPWTGWSINQMYVYNRQITSGDVNQLWNNGAGI